MKNMKKQSNKFIVRPRSNKSLAIKNYLPQNGTLTKIKENILVKIQDISFKKQLTAQNVHKTQISTINLSDHIQEKNFQNRRKINRLMPKEKYQQQSKKQAFPQFQVPKLNKSKSGNLISCGSRQNVNAYSSDSESIPFLIPYLYSKKQEFVTIKKIENRQLIQKNKAVSFCSKEDIGNKQDKKSISLKKGILKRANSLPGIQKIRQKVIKEGKCNYQPSIKNVFTCNKRESTNEIEVKCKKPKKVQLITETNFILTTLNSQTKGGKGYQNKKNSRNPSKTIDAKRTSLDRKCNENIFGEQKNVNTKCKIVNYCNSKGHKQYQLFNVKSKKLVIQRN